MEKKKNSKLVNNEEHTKLIKLFAEHSPEERSKLLNNIDNILLYYLYNFMKRKKIILKNYYNKKMKVSFLAALLGLASSAETNSKSHVDL